MFDTTNTNNNTFSTNRELSILRLSHVSSQEWKAGDEVEVEDEDTLEGTRYSGSIIMDTDVSLSVLVVEDLITDAIIEFHK
eukprot:gene1673-3233_t